MLRFERDGSVLVRLFAYVRNRKIKLNRHKHEREREKEKNLFDIFKPHNSLKYINTKQLKLQRKKWVKTAMKTMTMAASGSRSSSTLIAILAEVKRLRALLFCFACARASAIICCDWVAKRCIPYCHAGRKFRFCCIAGPSNFTMFTARRQNTYTHTETHGSFHFRCILLGRVLVHRTPSAAQQQPIQFYCISNAPAAHEYGAIGRTRNGQWSTF